MSIVSFNNLEQISFSENKIFEGFKGVFGKKSILISESGDFYYTGFIENSQLDIELIVDSCFVNGKFQFFIPVSEKKTNLHLLSQIKDSNVTIEIEIISFQKEQSQLMVDGTIQIDPHMMNITANLMEEVYLLGNTSQTMVKPALLVSSHEVKTAHGTKIQRIPIEILFYLQSRGISQHQAETLFIRNIVSNNLAPLHLSRDEEDQILTFFKRNGKNC